MKRFKHSLSHYKLFTADPGLLIPVGWYEALPGDSVQQATSLLVRVSPLLAPVMHPVSVRVHHWFVPNRLIWANWEKFITGGSDGEGDGSAYPYIAAGAGFAAGGLADYLGLPPSVALGNVSALPFRAYSLIFNEYYRDQDLVTERTVNTGDGADATTPVTVASIAWEKDYFTSARPWAQKGPAVTLPLGTSATVRTSDQSLVGDVPGTEAATFRRTSNGDFPSARINAGFDTGTGALIGDTTGAPTAADGYYPDNLYADLAEATSVDVNTVREAFALQRYEEARARYGSRYTEYLRYLGVRSSDARLQRPEYLGGGKQTIAFSEVLQTGTEFDSNDGVGTLRGHGIAAMRSRRFRRFFEEHGIVISLMSVRPRTMYVNGVPRSFLRETKEDYWQKELEHIGQQEIQNKEIYAAHATPTGTFGYNDRYAEYRHIQSSIAGEFRSTLNFWHLARIFAADPTLNSSFVTCDPATRIYASTATDALWIMASNSIQARRPVTRNPGGRIM